MEFGGLSDIDDHELGDLDGDEGFCWANLLSGENQGLEQPIGRMAESVWCEGPQEPLFAAAATAKRARKSTSPPKTRRVTQPRCAPAPSSSSVVGGKAHSTNPSTLDSSLPPATSVSSSVSVASGAVAVDAGIMATATLRNNSLHLLNGLTAQSLESFRNAFFGGCSSDDENDDEDDALPADNDKRKRKRSKRPNPDADLIALATDEQMRLSNFDPNTREGKRERRKIRNRMSALLHRERKKMYIEALESMVRDKDARIKQLELQVQLASDQSSTGNGESSRASSVRCALTDEESSVSSSSAPPTRPNSPTLLTTASRVGGSGIQVAASGGLLRSIVPLLSVFCLVCVAMLDGRGQLPGRAVSLLDPVSTTEVNRLLVSQQPPLSLALSSVALVPGPNIQSESHGGRRLLSANGWRDAPEPEFDERGLTFDPSILGASIPSHIRNSALWRDGKRLMTLYPRYLGDSKASVAHATNGSAVHESRRHSRTVRHLRSRSNSDISNGSSSGTAVANVKDAPVLGLVPASSTQLSTTIAAEAAPASPHPLPLVTTTSRVLMTHGKALLDPALTLTQEMPTTTTATTSRPATSTSLSYSSALSAWHAPQHNRPPVIVSSGQGSGSGSAGGPSSQVLVMLLPASQVRWGKVWGESVEGMTETILRALNETHGDSPNDAFGDAEQPQMWVEIGCSVFRAQLVQNVTLVA